ncbi:unnamed protein product [Rodentolepis nana]|uniref:Variant surface glycoprotein n=1 Tax=Rodentolepis nana TaxID=102285 RepID=A0A0R3TDW8_RODNA|nr:unnamed protein product [Rodentolepis nana]
MLQKGYKKNRPRQGDNAIRKIALVRANHNRPRQGESQRLQILQWTCQGESQRLQILQWKGRITTSSDPPVECFRNVSGQINPSRENPTNLGCYTLYNLPKYRQVASGILTGVKEGLASLYDLIKGTEKKRDALRNTADQTGRTNALRNTADLTGRTVALGNTADQTGETEDVQAWRRQSAVLRQAILQAKRISFDNFESNINYQSDNQRAFKFLGNVQNNRERPKKERKHFKKQTAYHWHRNS